MHLRNCELFKVALLFTVKQPDIHGDMATKNAFWERRNGYQVVLELWHDESRNVGGDVPDARQWSWMARLNGKDCTNAALGDSETTYADLNDQEVAIKRLRAYIDLLPSGTGARAQL
ncbi:hypothetical protein GCM10008949_38290 [Deinococcus humi]|nr:hypothetical protein GCM10008949_38290 [Deinococcus humi]